MSDQRKQETSSQQMGNQSGNSSQLRETYSDKEWNDLPREDKERYHQQFPGRRQVENTSSSGTNRT